MRHIVEWKHLKIANVLCQNFILQKTVMKAQRVTLPDQPQTITIQRENWKA